MSEFSKLPENIHLMDMKRKRRRGPKFLPKRIKDTWKEEV